MKTKNGSVMYVRRQSRYVHADSMEVSLSVTIHKHPVMATDNYFSHTVVGTAVSGCQHKRRITMDTIIHYCALQNTAVDP